MCRPDFVSLQVGGKAAGKVASFGVRTAAKLATLGHLGQKKEDEAAGKTKAEKRARAVRCSPPTLQGSGQTRVQTSVLLVSDEVGYMLFEASPMVVSTANVHCEGVPGPT